MGESDHGGAGDVESWRAEAERLAVENVVLRGRVAELEGQVGALAEKVSVLARLAFGTSSEKAAERAPGGDDQPMGRAATPRRAGRRSADEGSGGARAGTGAGTTRTC